MRTAKGCFGYIRYQKVWRFIRTVGLFALSFGVYALGLYLNKGDKRSIYTIVAAVGMIPGALSAVGMIVMWLRKPISRQLYEEVEKRRGDLRVLYELYITSKDGSMMLDTVAVCGEYITGYTTETDNQEKISMIEKHIRRCVLQQGYRTTVKIFSNEKNFMERLEQMAEKKEEYEKARDGLVETILKQLAI